MSELFWPGDGRAGDLLTDGSFVAAMVAVESAWVGAELAVPPVALAPEVEAGGNALIPLVAALREANPGVAVHTGLTSQDVIDTALILMLRDAISAARGHITGALAGIDRLDAASGAIPMTGRTLTQWALPITFGHKLATWRSGLAGAEADLAALVLPAQCGGPVGTLRDGRLADRLGLVHVPSWHTDRRPITRIADALVAATDAAGRIARDVLELSRPEIGELSEAAGGGSSSMPHKANPVLSVLVRRAALSSPHLLATLHLCAADQVDERADGAWHAEWDTLRLLGRRTVVALSQTADLLDGLQVHADRMTENLSRAEERR